MHVIYSVNKMKLAFVYRKKIFFKNKNSERKTKHEHSNHKEDKATDEIHGIEKLCCFYVHTVLCYCTD